MSFQVMEELGQAFGMAKSDDTVRVVVLTGAGERAFCAGADLGGIGSNARPAPMHEARGGPPAPFKQPWHLGQPALPPGPGYCPARGVRPAPPRELVVP